MTTHWDAIIGFASTALLHAIWQVALIGVLLFAFLRFGRIHSPHWRYGVCVAGLAAILIAPVATALTPLAELWLYGPVSVSRSTPAMVQKSVSVAESPVLSTTTSAPADSAADLFVSTAPSAERPGRQKAVTEGLSASTAVAATSDLNGGEDALKGPPAWLRALMIFYFLGVAAMFGRLSFAQGRLTYLRLTAVPAPPEMRDLLDELRKFAGIARRIQICISDRIVLPILIGVLRPVILIPSSMAGLSSLDLEIIILHELAHIRRHDALINLLQRTAEAFLFFHPVVWMLGREMRRQRELCCDAWVISRTEDELEYARCLTEVARQAVAGPLAAPAMAMAEPRHEVPRRILAALDGSARAARVLPAWTFGLMLLAAFAGAALLAFAAPGSMAAQSGAQAYAPRPMQAIYDAGQFSTGAPGLPNSVSPGYSVPPAPGAPLNPPGVAPQPQGSGAFGAVQPAQPPAPKQDDRILVLTGERVTCRVTDALLEDVHYEHRPADEKSEYYDDGTRGDVTADDNIWTRFDERNDVLSPAADQLRRRYQNMMRQVERTRPINFFGGIAATDDPGSRLAWTVDQEQTRDETYLRKWNEKFLSEYRTNPEDPTSEFFPVHVPRPPRAPDTPAPSGDEFQPIAYALNGFTRQMVTAVTANMTSQTRSGPAASRVKRAAPHPISSTEDPIDFLYVSGEYVFDLLILAQALNVPGVQVNLAAGPVHPLDAVSVSNNPGLETLLNRVRREPDWQRVVRIPLATSERETIDRAIADAYAIFMRATLPQTQPGASVGYTGGSSFADDSGSGNLPGQGPPAPAIDPVGLAQWYWHYQETAAWERYVREEVLVMKRAESPDLYDLRTAVVPQDLYLVPQAPNGPLPLIQFDGQIGEVGAFLSAVRPPGQAGVADHIYHVMLDYADANARAATQLSRRLIAGLDERQQRRAARRNWYEERAAEINRFARDFRKRQRGDATEAAAGDFLVSPSRLSGRPSGAPARTPYDILNPDGTLKDLDPYRR